MLDNFKNQNNNGDLEIQNNNLDEIQNNLNSLQLENKKFNSFNNLDNITIDENYNAFVLSNLPNKYSTMN